MGYELWTMNYYITVLTLPPRPQNFKNNWNSLLQTKCKRVQHTVNARPLDNIIKRTPAQSTKMRLCAFRESTFIEEQMYAVPICEHGCATYNLENKIENKQNQ